MTLPEQMVAAVKAIPRVHSFTGTFVRMDGPLAVVNLNDTQIRVRCDGWNPPIQDQFVRLESVDGAVRVVGPAQTAPAEGVVQSVSGSVVTVLIGSLPYKLRFLDTGAGDPVSGNTVIIDWASGTVLGKAGEAPPIPDPPPAPGGGGAPFSDLVIQSVSSGRFDSRWWGNGDPWASNTNVGAWFYEGAFTALAGVAGFSRVEVFLPLQSQLGNASIGIHPHPSQPPGGPGIGSTHPLPLGGRNGWVALPNGWGEHLRDNPTHGIGVTAPGGGYTRWAGRPSNHLSGALRFAGTR